MSTLALVFWVVLVGIVFRVIVEQGGWSGFVTWLKAKFGAVSSGSSSSPSTSSGSNTSPAGGTAGNSLGQAARKALGNLTGGA